MNTRTLAGTFVFCLALQFGDVSIVAGQDAGQNEFRNELESGLSRVLTYKGVAADLELTDAQKEKLFGLDVEIQTRIERALKDYRMNFSPRFGSEKRQELKNRFKDSLDDIRALELERLDTTLLPGQIKRLKQIRFQILRRNNQGLRGLVDELSLGDDQLAKFKKLQKVHKRSILELRQVAVKEQLTQRELADEMADIKKETETKMLEVLSRSQRARLKQLGGEPFQFRIGPPKDQTEDDDRKPASKSSSDK